MYLKSIEVQGFKSFANKIHFEFHNGITGIVGPNGSGKSNVADAVRWVLGEQKVKQLRGSKMEDVIFSGTENRKPLGYAYVAITLDNTDHQLPIDFDEVTVSRRIFRSGESEYLINGSVCRLKDVYELFYDTGIGKEGYSIIGQGQIDKILSGKPEERRELFDEAAGIVKFKRRKLIAQKKLEDEKQNLVRVNDILSELEKQVKPLERQSEVAKEYLKLKEELKIYDVNQFLLEITRIKEQLKTVEERYTIATDELNSTKSLHENTKIEYEQLEKTIEELNLTIEEKKGILSQTNLQKSQFESDIKVLQEQINAANQNEEHYNQRKLSIQTEIESKSQEITALEQEISLTRDALLQAESNQKAAESSLSEITMRINNLIFQIEDSKNEIIGLLNEKSSIKAKIQRYDTMLEQSTLRKAEINQRLLKIKSDEALQDQFIQNYEEDLQRINNSIIHYNTKSEQITAKIAEMQNDNKSLQEHLSTAQHSYHSEKSKLDSLRNMTERYEGYGNSIKKVMELKDSKKGIVGVVADIIKTDKKYEIALETALGGNIQNIVTETEQTAKELIEYLKKNKFGRATFLPLSSISNKTGFQNEKALTEKGVIGLASDLVQIDEDYSGIAKYLLGRIVVVDNIDHALALARKYSYTLRIVTLEGELLNAGGSLSGGAFKNASNLLGRRREIEEMEKQVDHAFKKLNELTEQIAQNRTVIENLNTDAEENKKLLQEQFILQNTAKLNLNQAEGKKKDFIEGCQDLYREANEIEVQIKELNHNNDELNTQLGLLEDKNNNLEKLISNLSYEVEQIKSQESEQMKGTETIRLESAGLLQKVAFQSENLKRITLERNRLKEESALIDNSKSNIFDDIKQKQAQIDEINKALSDAEQKAIEFDGEIQTLVSRREELTKTHKDFFTKRDSLASQMNDLDKEIYRLNNQREKFEEMNETQINYMWNEYELTYSVAIDMRNDELDNLTLIKKNIGILKSKIRELGDVNVNAIDDYKSVKERYEFLKTQHDDLIKAEESLIKIIEELDKGMRTQFKEKFEQIKVEFDKVFKELFGGGSGTLELMEDEDILEAGIRIISQPPGKKLQNMMQLSGGEKALTAIALLFAIQNLKPSPFCLLDEIEAALDDSNVSRFAKYLHKLTKNTQFIIITHRRGTMAAADRLYGITMQEKGVSTLVSVNLLEDQLDK